MEKFLPVLFLFSALFTFGVFSVDGQTNAAKQTIDDFSVTTVDGKTYNTAELRGKLIVVNLWYINCPNCMEEIGLLNKLVDEYQGKADVIFLGLATNNQTQLQSFLKKNPFKYQIVPSATNLMLTKFGTPDKNGQINIPFPMHIVVDRTGKKVLSVAGVKGVEAVRNELKNQFASKNVK